MSVDARRGAKFPLPLRQVQSRRRADVVETRAAAAVNSRSVLRPQRLLEQAHVDAARPQLPVGLGMDSAAIRRQMVQRLRQTGLGHQAVLDAMAAVPRHQFVDAALAAQAYEDTSLPIGHGQTISKPSVVGRMIALLFEGANARQSGHLGRVLEVGTGCGYQAAVLARLGRFVISIERIKPLFDRTRSLMGAQGADGLRLVFGDGTLGHPPNAPYDSIIAAAGGDSMPAAWPDQLNIGGRLVVPMRQPGEDRQVLVVVDRTEQGFRQTLHEAVNFVPLKSGLIG